jgi:hypothetical protein
MSSRDERQDRVVADRVTVDIEGLREEIESAYFDKPLWEELSLSQKLRRLIQERLNEIKQERAASKDSGSK